MRSLKPDLISIDKEALSSVEPIIRDLEEYHNNIESVMKEMDIPQNLIEQFSMWYPRFSKLLPGEVVNFYQFTKRQTVEYLLSKGYSHRAIAREMGGESATTINRLIKEYDEQEKDS